MAEHWDSLLLMSYVCAPQLFFYGVFFLIGQVLNARDHFGPMMWAPIANNVVSIGVFGLYLWVWGNQTALTGEPFTDQQAWLLALGSTIGIIVQTLALLPFLKRAGFSYRPRFDLKGTGLGRTFHVAKWMVGYVALTTLVQMLVANLASGATVVNDADAGGGAGWTVYQNAYLVWILPHSLLTVSLATAMLPSASRFAVAGDRAGVAAETTRALRLATTFLVPAAVGLAVLADPDQPVGVRQRQRGERLHLHRLGPDRLRRRTDPVHDPVPVPACLLRDGQHQDAVPAADLDQRRQRRRCRSPSRCRGATGTPWRPGLRSRTAFPTSSAWPSPTSSCADGCRSCPAGRPCSTSDACWWPPCPRARWPG